jgi:hypothetical protein
LTGLGRQTLRYSSPNVEIPMATLRTLWWPLASALTILPPYVFEKLAEHYFLLHSSYFGFFSGQRYYFDIYFLAFAGVLIGYKSRSLVRAWITNVISVLVLMTLFFAVCDPILCYSTGVDGLEPARMGSFFIAVGIATTYLGHRGSDSAKKVDWEMLLTGGCAFYAIAYIPMIFTLTGATILAPADGVALPALLAFLAFTVVLFFSDRTRPFTVLFPFAAQAALVLIGIGIARQYYSEILPTVGLTLLATLAGTAFGAYILLRSARTAAHFRRSPLPFVGMVVFVILVSLVVWPDAVVGQVASISNSGAPANYSYSIPDSAGGFMSSPMVRPTAVRVNVTFSSYDPSSVPAGWFLAGGIGVHSADCCTDGTDYGYRYDAILYGNGSQLLSASAWKVCDSNGACGGHSWRVLLYFVSRPFAASPDEQLQLTLGWQNHTVVWEYSIGGETDRLGAFEASARANAAFNAGWFGPPDNPSPGGAFFFQFGVSKLGNLNVPWSVSFKCPSIFWNGAWNCIDHSESLQGDQSYWKVLWRWGETFPGVQAQANATAHTVTFRDSNSTMGSFVTFW